MGGIDCVRDSKVGTPYSPLSGPTPRNGKSGILITQKLFLMKSVTPSNFAHYHFNTKGLGTFRRGHSQSHYTLSMDVLRINSFSGTKIASGNTAQKTFFISLASYITEISP